MLRFIFNFFLFGLLFYLIYLFFPEAFQTLVSWANHTYEFLKDLFMQLSAKIQSSRSDHSLPQQTLGWMVYMPHLLTKRG